MNYVIYANHRDLDPSYLIILFSWFIPHAQFGQFVSLIPDYNDQ